MNKGLLISKKANDNIRFLMRIKDLGIKDMANRTGISVSVFGRKLRSLEPKWTLLEAALVSQVLGVKMDVIFLSDSIPIGIIEENGINKISV